MFRAVQYQNRSEGETTYSEALLREDADLAFRNLVTEGTVLGAGTLGCVIEAGEDQENLLLLTLHIELHGTSIPIETVLEAAFGKSRPLRDTVRKALKDAASAAAEMVVLVDAPPSRLKEALASSEADIQLFAAKLIGEKKIKGASPSLARMLKDPREEAADAAADALMKTATSEDVPLIIQSISKNSLRSEVRAMEIIAAVGGSEAEAYLEMTALGHEVPEVRAVSESLLKMMRSSKKRAAVGR